MPKKTHVRHRHHNHSSEEGFISDTVRKSMNKNEKIIMGVLAGGIVVFLAISIILLFGRGGSDETGTTQVPGMSGQEEKRVLTPYPTIPPVENMTVMLNSRRFNPQSFSIPRGGMVVFLNIDTSPITIEANDGNSGVLNIGEIGPAETREIIMTEPGTYTYRNKAKPTMVGVITIR